MRTVCHNSPIFPTFSPLHTSPLAHDPYYPAKIHDRVADQHKSRLSHGSLHRFCDRCTRFYGTSIALLDVAHCVFGVRLRHGCLSGAYICGVDHVFRPVHDFCRWIISNRWNVGFPGPKSGRCCSASTGQTTNGIPFTRGVSACDLSLYDSHASVLSTFSLSGFVFIVMKSSVWLAH